VAGELQSLVESARFLLLLSKLYQQQNRYEGRLAFMSKAKEVQDRFVYFMNCWMVCVL